MYDINKFIANQGLESRDPDGSTRSSRVATGAGVNCRSAAAARTINRSFGSVH